MSIPLLNSQMHSITPYQLTSGFISFFKESHGYITNHQKWQIRLDGHAGLAMFHLKDKHGISHTTSEYMIENVPSELLETLSNCTSQEEQQAWILPYLQMRWKKVTPYQIHVEHHHHKLVVRFGDYGLKGGGKTTAYICSGIVIVMGIGLTAFRNPDQWTKIASSVLISTGLASAQYAYSTNEDHNPKQQEKSIATKTPAYKSEECASMAISNFATGAIVGGMSSLWKERR